MTRMPIDELEANSNFIKILDEKVAVDLSTNYGFFYTVENINCGEQVYVFKNSEALQSVLGELVQSSYAQGAPIVYDSKMYF